jgi:hypothetical protein
MRLSETITIYLAVGAPFAVSYFLRQQAAEGRAHLLLKTTVTGLLWPLVAVKIFYARLRRTLMRAKLYEEPVLQPHAEKIDGARRNFLGALHTVRELATDAPGVESEKLERAVYVLRDCVETFVGLAQAVKEAMPDAPPDERELELFRLAGRKGDDLMLAGRLAHRRNVARLREHHARARTEMLHALAEIREAADGLHPARVANFAAARRLSVETLRLYGCAVDLLSLMEETSAAMSVAQLLNQECARLRRMPAAETVEASGYETGEGLCTAHTSRLSHASLSRETRLAQG